ncbi:MAG: DHH family phosphoesterase [Candidatus Altimarinota bacterium]
MENSVFQQITAFIERSEKILLCTHRKPDGDAIGSIMAMYKALNLLGKEVTAACADELPEMFHFLPEIDHLNQDVPGGKDFVVTLDCDQTEVDRLKYHLEDNKIHIVITPKKGTFRKENVSCQERTDHYDLIITVDVADISQLGKLYEDNAELFTSTPIINIDHHISNPGFGKINLIDVASSSTAEILYGLIRHLEQHFQKNLIVPETATFLLSGVTTDTGSFQNANTTPKSMDIAADLMEAGANQQDIIKYLFRTKKLSTLKLWGRILTKLEVDEKHKLVWSSITQQDLKQTGAHMDESGDIIDELLVHAPEAEIVVLFKEDPDLVSVSFRSKNAQANVMEIAQEFGGGGHVQASGVKFPGKTLQEVMNMVLSAAQQRQRVRLGLEEDQIVQQPEITQVLEGYTPMAKHVEPTLEERVGKGGDGGDRGNSAMKLDITNPNDHQRNLKAQSSKLETSEPHTNPALPPLPAIPSHPTPRDIHSEAKKAIEAEQGHEENKLSAPAPSVSTRQAPPTRPPERPMAQKLEALPKSSPEKKPEAPKKPETAQKPEAPQKPEDDGVKVSFNQPAKAPEIPAGSADPVVKPANTKPSNNPFSSMNPDDLDDEGEKGEGDIFSAKPPQPPKDPFSTGDDGLTDIERALGGL